MKKMFACTGSAVDVSSVPTEIKILPLGLVHSQKGDFVVDEESFRLIEKQFKNRQLDLVIDYEHQTLMGTQAPAGGWIKSLSMGTDAIIATVSWTKKAEEYLKNKEYRYLSPVVMVRNSDTKAIQLQSAALTNVPAIDGMFAIVNSSNALFIDETDNEDLGGNKMDLKKLAKLLGLPEDADEDVIEKALAAIVEKATSGEKNTPGEKDGESMVANNTILSLLNLTEAAKTEEVVASILSLKSPEADTKQKLEELTAKVAKKEADDAVSLALKDGKISASQREWATQYALKDPKGFENFVTIATPVVPMGKTVYAATGGNTTQEEVEPMILKNLGFDDEEIKKMIAKEKK